VLRAKIPASWSSNRSGATSLLFACQRFVDEMSPYERLLGDALGGDASLFARQGRSRSRKVQISSLWDAVEGRVLVYIHKEQKLADVERLYPARHYVMLDDKLRILNAMKVVWGDRLTTVFPLQGSYVLDPGNEAACPPADITIEHIGEIVNLDLTSFLGTTARHY
jgi:hypothetical protein